MTLAHTTLTETQRRSDLLHGQFVLVVADQDDTVPVIQVLAGFLEELAVVDRHHAFALPAIRDRIVIVLLGVTLWTFASPLASRPRIERRHRRRSDFSPLLCLTLLAGHPIHFANVVDSRTMKSHCRPRRKRYAPFRVESLNAVHECDRRTRCQVFEVGLNVDLQRLPAVERHESSQWVVVSGEKIPILFAGIMPIGVP